jgi:signal transduction histidine kinase
MTKRSANPGGRTGPASRITEPRRKQAVRGRETALALLRERIKELEALHNTSRLLHLKDLPVDFVMADIIESLPRAWQYPKDTVVRIRYGSKCYASSRFRPTRWRQSAEFGPAGKSPGAIDVCYLEKKPTRYEGPFLREERDLINSLAEMLNSFFQRREAEQALRSAYRDLNLTVDRRTAELRKLNLRLKAELNEHRRDQDRIRRYQQQLRDLASELSLVEERERKSIASDLHDQIGQALAMIKLKLMGLPRSPDGSGLRREMDDIHQMLDRAIQHTRNLTFEISPPVLYELGLVPAIEWLGEQFQAKHQLKVLIESRRRHLKLSDEMQFVLFKTVRELLVNAVKHSGAGRVRIALKSRGRRLSLTVRDDGSGFDPDKLKNASIRGSGFGLVSIRERLKCLGGDLAISSAPGSGTTAEVTVKLS